MTVAATARQLLASLGVHPRRPPRPRHPPDTAADLRRVPAGTPGEHVIAAPRAVYNRAIAEINTATRTSGNGTILDALLLRLHTETACRRGGALGIRVADPDADRCLVRLQEKGNTPRWPPISPALTHCLTDHAAARGSELPTYAAPVHLQALIQQRLGH